MAGLTAPFSLGRVQPKRRPGRDPRNVGAVLAGLLWWLLKAGKA